MKNTSWFKTLTNGLVRLLSASAALSGLIPGATALHPRKSALLNLDPVSSTVAEFLNKGNHLNLSPVYVESEVLKDVIRIRENFATVKEKMKSDINFSHDLTALLEHIRSFSDEHLMRDDIWENKLIRHNPDLPKLGYSFSLTKPDGQTITFYESQIYALQFQLTHQYFLHQRKMSNTLLPNPKINYTLDDFINKSELTNYLENFDEPLDILIIFMMNNIGYSHNSYGINDKEISEKYRANIATFFDAITKASFQDLGLLELFENYNILFKLTLNLERIITETKQDKDPENTDSVLRTLLMQALIHRVTIIIGIGLMALGYHLRNRKAAPRNIENIAEPEGPAKSKKKTKATKEQSAGPVINHVTPPPKTTVIPPAEVIHRKKESEHPHELNSTQLKLFNTTVHALLDKHKTALKDFKLKAHDINISLEDKTCYFSTKHEGIHERMLMEDILKTKGITQKTNKALFDEVMNGIKEPEKKPEPPKIVIEASTPTTEASLQNTQKEEEEEESKPVGKTYLPSQKQKVVLIENKGDQTERILDLQFDILQFTGSKKSPQLSVIRNGIVHLDFKIEKVEDIAKIAFYQGVNERLKKDDLIDLYTQHPLYQIFDAHNAAWVGDHAKHMESDFDKYMQMIETRFLILNENLSDKTKTMLIFQIGEIYQQLRNADKFSARLNADPRCYPSIELRNQFAHELVIQPERIKAVFDAVARHKDNTASSSSTRQTNN